MCVWDIFCSIVSFNNTTDNWIHLVDMDRWINHSIIDPLIHETIHIHVYKSLCVFDPNIYGLVFRKICWQSYLIQMFITSNSDPFSTAHTHTHRLERSLIHKPFAFLFISIMRTNTICNLVSFSLSVYGRINPTQGKHRYNGRQILWWFLNERATQNRRTRNRVLCPMFGEHWSGRSDMFIRLQSSNNDHLPLQLYIVDNGAKYSMAQ